VLRRKKPPPIGFPEARLLQVMPYRKPMLVREILLAVGAPFQQYGEVKRVLEALEQAQWVESVLRRPPTGRTGMAWRRIAALPR
jgi:hypothetical protein